MTKAAEGEKVLALFERGEIDFEEFIERSQELGLLSKEERDMALMEHAGAMISDTAEYEGWHSDN